MVTKIEKAAGTETTAMVRAAGMMVQMARGKARAAAERVKRMRKKVKAAKKDLKQVKRAARQAKKSLKTAQSAFEIAKTKNENKKVREPQAASAAARPATVRARRKRPSLKKAPDVEVALSPAPGSQPVVPSVCATSMASEPNEARP